MGNTVLITGATGKQGGAVIESLLSAPDISDLSILAVTRNSESGAAKALVAKDPQRITLVKGDLNDCEAIFKAVSGPIHSVFCVSIPTMGPGANPESEEVQSKALIDAALAHKVQHFVFTSVDRHGAENLDTEVPHFISKAHIERHLIKESANTQMTWTILRPTAFMDNMIPGFAGKIFPTAWKVGLSPTTRVQLISTADIGWFAAQALLNPKEFAGRAISLAGDDLSFEEMNAVFAKEVGYDIPVTFGFIASAMIWAVKDLSTMFKFFEDVGYGADIAALRKEHPELRSFGDWVKTSAFVKK